MFDINDPAQKAALRSEVLTDPRGYGYAAFVATGNIVAVQGLINAVRDGTNPPANPTAAGGSADGKITLRRPTIPRAEILNAIDLRDFPASPGQISNLSLAASWFGAAVQTEWVVVTDPDGTKNQVRRNFDRLVANTNGSQDRLDAIAVRSASRAEELFGYGTNLDHLSIGIAIL